jgi:diaminopimelate epimerase
VTVEFSKYHGLSNDFLLVYEQPISPELARQMCDRYTGVGADGVILISKSKVADYSFLLYNSDGSTAEVSGNGLRCVGKFLYEKGFHSSPRLSVEAGGDIKTLELDVRNGSVASISVDMGVPVMEGEIDLHGRTWKLVSMGNPHAVTFVEDIESAPVVELGPLMENDPVFPNRTNVEFVKVDGDILHVRFWERGVGITNASGTGSSAAVAASGLKKSTVRTLGGELLFDVTDDGRLLMIGPAVHVFDGSLP